VKGEAFDLRQMHGADIAQLATMAFARCESLSGIDLWSLAERM
jgi:hypothetical protein